MATTRKMRKKVSDPVAPEITSLIPGPDDLNEPPNRLTDYCILIFGEKGIGKTSLAAQFPHTLTIMTEPRRRNLRIRQVSVEPRTLKEMYAMKKVTRHTGENFQTPWQFLGEVVSEALTDPTVKTLALDTIDRIYDMALTHHCYEREIADPSALNDYGATWRDIKVDFEDLLRRILASGKGLVLLSHARLRPVEVRGGDGYDILCPTCTPAAFDILKALTDYAFYYGYFSKQRAMFLRGNDLIWSACGVDDRFMSPQGDPLTVISMGKSASESYTNLTAGFDNKVEDLEAFRNQE